MSALPLSAWWPEHGEVEADGVSRCNSVPEAYKGSVREIAEYIAQRDWNEGDYWAFATLRVRWIDGVAYEFAIEVESMPHFVYSAKEVSP